MSNAGPARGKYPVVAVAALLAAMLCFATGTSFAKGLFPHVGAAGTTTYRVAFASLILLAIWRPWRHPLTPRDARTIALYGAAMGLMNLSFYLSLRTIPFGVALVLEFTGPLAVAIFSSRRLVDFFWIAFAVTGLLLLLPVAGNTRLDPLGAAYALGGGVFWALYIIFGHRARHLHGGQSVSLGMLVAALVVTPFGVAHAGATLLTPTLLLGGLAVGIVSSALPYTLEMVALKRLPHRTFSILLSLEPALGALAGVIVLAEKLTALQWLAVACIIIASAGTASSAREAEVPPPPVVD